MSTTMEKYEGLKRQLANVKEDLKQSAKIGTHSMLTAGGGVIAGWCYAKQPNVPNTNFPLAAAIGSGLVLGSLANLFSEYSEPASAVGSGLLAVVLSKESEKYFKS